VTKAEKVKLRRALRLLYSETGWDEGTRIIAEMCGMITPGMKADAQIANGNAGTVDVLELYRKSQQRPRSLSEVLNKEGNHA